MSLIVFRELYLAELNDLYAAEHAVLHELPLLAAGAHAEELRLAFEHHYVQTRRHVQRLEALFQHLDERPRRASGRALRAIIEDARLRHAHIDRGQALDAALIAAAQRIEHYEIAAYRSAHGYAIALADVNGAGLLLETLEEEGGMDRTLVALARAGDPRADNPRQAVSH
jgi:ferritin-like metal-binding protein YciE